MVWAPSRPAPVGLLRLTVTGLNRPVRQQPCAIRRALSSSPLAAVRNDNGVTTSYRFVYFDLRGAGELCRLALVTAGCEWQDIRYPMSVARAGFSWGPEFQRDAQTGAFDINMGKLPVLQVVVTQQTGNEASAKKILSVATIGQSPAIARFVAQQHGLMGSANHPLQQAYIDGIFESCRDIRSAWYKAKKTPETKRQWFQETLGDHCRSLEGAIVASEEQFRSLSNAKETPDTPWCLGSATPTLADVAAYHMLSSPTSLTTGSSQSFFDGADSATLTSALVDCPRLSAIVKEIGSMPAIKEWEERRPDSFS